MTDHVARWLAVLSLAANLALLWWRCRTWRRFEREERRHRWDTLAIVEEQRRIQRKTNESQRQMLDAVNGGRVFYRGEG